MRQLVLPHFLQASQAILTINIFDERPHDRTPLLVSRGRVDPVLFQDCFVAIGKWFLEGNAACAKAARERWVLFDWPALRGQWKIGQFGPAGSILIYSKQKEASFGNSGSYSRTWLVG